MPLLAPLLSDMKIASFNVQRFGLKKVSDPAVVSTLVKVKQPEQESVVSDFSQDLVMLSD